MKHIPNLLTLLRLFMIPFYFMVFYSGRPNALMESLYIFVAASITDVLDGYLARKYQVISNFGKVADPFADKAMQLSVLYTLSDANYLRDWFFWVILVKEALQIGLGGILVSRRPRIIVPANKYGKATTFLVFLTVILAVFRVPGIQYLQVFVAGWAILTFVQYAIHVGGRFLERRRRRQHPDSRS